MRTPSSGSIEEIADSATTMPDSCTDFFAAIPQKGSSRRDSRRSPSGARAPSFVGPCGGEPIFPGPPTSVTITAMADYRYVVCDVFTDTPLEGNQLAVFTDGRGVADETMQALAREINFSEVTFVLPAEAGGHARIRIFTPLAELPFAGHPTLGTAFVLAGPLQTPELRLETGKGIVPVRLEREENRIVFGRMEQPIPTVQPYEAEAELLAALGVERSELPVELYDNGIRHVYVCLRSEDEVAGLRPDLGPLELPPDLTVNCFAGSGSHWKT